jgi:predicted SprT family Zn-dependent metalloprotease
MNKLIIIKQFAIMELKKWGLTGSHNNDWCFVWDNKAKRRYGQCRYNKKEIGITKQLVAINSIEESKDVVLHEIAHALTGSGHGHDAMWRRMCIKVGARPERCYINWLIKTLVKYMLPITANRSIKIGLLGG